MFEVKGGLSGQKATCYRCSSIFAVESNKDRDIWWKQPIISVIAYHQQFIDRNVFEQCFEECRGVENKNRAILNYLKQARILNQEQSDRLKELYILFVTRHEDIRFGALCVSFKMVSESIIKLALEEQQELADKTGEKKFLGDFLVEAGMITEKQRSLILLKQKRELAIIVVEKGKKKGKGVPIPGKPEKKKGKFAGKAGKKQVVDVPEVPMKEVIQKGLSLKIQHDGLKAYLVKTSAFDKVATVHTIKQFLEKNGIIFGVPGQKELAEFIDDFPQDSYFTVAKGSPAVDSKETQFTYSFDHDYLKAGSVDQNGTIDFKERGIIPEVKEGTLLARKIPMQQGKNGTNIFGENILPVLIKDEDINCGRGVRLSEDTLELYAAINGFPKIEIDGSVSVVQEYTINGDVDYSTGHIDFDGNVNISGTIKSGFKVKAHDVTVDSIEGGTITSSGDVIVQKGISKATIFTRGSLSALFIHHSDVQCMGSLNVHKEILDSSALVNGACISKLGRILASSICAKMGVRVHSIGTEHTKQSTIVAGMSTYTETELKRVNNLLEQQQKQIDEHYADKEAVEAELSALDLEISESDPDRKRTEEIIIKLEKNDTPKFTRDGQNVLDIFKSNFEKIENKLEKLKEKKEALENQIESITIDINLGSQKVKSFVKEMLTLRQLDHDSPPNPTIEVDGQIMHGTKIGGRHSQTIVNEIMSRVRIREIAVPSHSASETSSWVLEIGMM